MKQNRIDGLWGVVLVGEMREWSVRKKRTQCYGVRMEIWFSSGGKADESLIIFVKTQRKLLHMLFRIFILLLLKKSVLLCMLG
jgi:hypothetical protein